MSRIVSLALVLVTLVACGNGPDAAATTPAPTVAAAPAPEVAAAPAPEAPADGALHVADLTTGWTAASPRIGQEVTVTGVFGNAMRVGGALQSASVGVSADDMTHISCEFETGHAPESITLAAWHDPITVHGVVADSYGHPVLEHCTIVD